MGILNITPDSFSDGGIYYKNPDKAIKRAIEIQESGADIIDIGAQSTRPGFTQISPEQEFERLFPVLKKINNYINIPISIDTFYPEVAQYSINLGASIINNININLNYTSKILDIINKNQKNTGIIITCNKIKNKTCENIKKFFENSILMCKNHNISHENICLDPGIGFTDSRDQDRNIIQNLNKIKIKNIPILIGISRKRVVAEFVNNYYNKNILKNNNYYQVLSNISVNIISMLNGADIIRVHDVQESVFVNNLINFILNKF